MRSWTAIATPGLEPVVARELEDHGLTGQVVPGAVTFRAPLDAGAALAWTLRTPARLLLAVAESDCRTLDDLARLVRGADWRPFLSRHSAVEVAVSSRASRLRHKDSTARKVEHALADVRRRLPPRQTRPFVTQRVQVRLDQDRASIAIDAGGELLHRRGWRQEPGKAPLRENLAASLLVAAGWTGDEPLVDPFCGAGTLPVEAALLALGRPPHLGRRFAAEEWPGLRGPRPPAPGPLAPPPVVVLGADHNPQVLLAAQDNARRARVSVEWRHCDVADLEAPAPTGLVVANPPYGARLGATVAGVYSAFGRMLRERFGGWRCAFLAPDPDLARRMDVGARAVTVFANGGIRVALYAVEP